jgi:hypothetical protein
VNGAQAGEGVSVRALNFKQLHKFLSCAGDKKLNEVRLCLEGVPGYYQWNVVELVFFPQLIKTPLEPSWDLGLQAQVLYSAALTHLADNALSTRTACITVLRVSA